MAATSKEALEEIPANPATLLGGLNTKYTVAASVVVKNIPADIRTGGMQMLGMVLQAAAAQAASGEAPADFGVQVGDSMNQLTQVVNDLDTIQLGLAVDRTANAIRLDLTTTAVAGSKTAQAYAKFANTKTDLAGLADPNAAILATVTVDLTPDVVAQYKGLLATAKQRLQDRLTKGSAPPKSSRRRTPRWPSSTRRSTAARSTADCPSALRRRTYISWRGSRSPTAPS